MPRPRLHNFFRSSTSTRLRVVLNLKGIECDYTAYALRKGETRTPEFLALNPQGLVPALELVDGTVLTQSLAIMEWLEETYPNPPILPSSPLDRARVRSLAYAIACEVHPLNNLRVLGRLASQFGADEAGQGEWFRHWAVTTMEPVEQLLAGDKRTGKFCHGNVPGLADACLYAQILNNRRFDIDNSPFPTIRRIFEACDDLEPFQQAAPERQPDAS